MAQYSLPPGASRRRAVFGLLDANGWGWAGLKASFWFLFIIFMLGYIPNLAYYFTVSNTVTVGYNFASIINWCPTTNDGLNHCPAPAGAVVPWQPSPPELVMPSARSDAVAIQSGSHLYVAGGLTPAGATAETLATTASQEGNLTAWTQGPALPEPRSGAAVATVAGTPYVIGGLDADGVPTTSVFMGTVTDGTLTEWVRADGANGTPDLTLPTGLADAVAVPTTNGIFVFGGRTSDGLSDRVWHAKYGATSPPQLGAWQEVSALPLPAPRAGAAAAAIGDTIYIVGGEGPDGVTSSIFRLTLQAGEPAGDPTTNAPIGWAVAPPSQQLPEPLAQASGFTANGVLYVIGGLDANGQPVDSNWWAVPDAKTGDLPAWQSLDETQLVGPRAGASITSLASHAFLFGGIGPTGAVDTSMRANLSPAPPFFQLGLFGATIPALSIKGEIGQQLGYINAMTAGLVNFAVLVLIGWAFSHRSQTLRLMEWVTRGRFRAPREEGFTRAS